MPDLSTVLSVPAFSAWAYDPTRKQLYIVSSDGKIVGWNVQTQTTDFTLSIGGTPGSAAVSMDGRYLVVGHADRIVTSAPFAVEPTYANEVTRIDLTNLSQTQIRFAIPGDELGVRDVAVTATGTVLITGDYDGSGFTPVRSFRISDPDGSFVNSTFPTSLPGEVTDNSQLLVSEGGAYVLIQLGNSTPGQAYLYQSATGTVVGESDPWRLHTGALWGGGDISEARGLVVNVAESGVHAFDLRMNPVANLSTYGTGGAIAGAAFSPDGSRIYLWQGEQSHVFVLDSTTFQQVGTLELSATIDAPSYLSSFSMDVIDGGRFLVLDTGTSLHLVDIAARLNTQIDPVTRIGSAGSDSLAGGAGADTLDGGDGANLLRGGYGADQIRGGADFDDINGNQGDDVAYGGAGEDWVVGGKGADRLFGDGGGDIVYGNIGNDTLEGGDGADVVRGGQGNDTFLGGAGDDWLSGDRGDDTMAGGAGADVFHSFTEAGIDRVIDFNAADGDRVQLDPGTLYTASQVGGDTVINMGGLGRMVLVGVQHAALPSGWLFGA